MCWKGRKTDFVCYLLNNRSIVISCNCWIDIWKLEPKTRIFSTTKKKVLISLQTFVLWKVDSSQKKLKAAVIWWNRYLNSELLLLNPPDVLSTPVLWSLFFEKKKF